MEIKLFFDISRYGISKVKNEFSHISKSRFEYMMLDRQLKHFEDYLFKCFGISKDNVQMMQNYYEIMQKVQEQCNLKFVRDLNGNIDLIEICINDCINESNLVLYCIIPIEKIVISQDCDSNTVKCWWNKDIFFKQAFVVFLNFLITNHII